MTRSVCALLAAVALSGFSPEAAFGHDELVISGKIAAIDHGAIVVSERFGRTPRTVSLLADTEIFACKGAKDLNGVSPGTPVRIKYTDAGRRAAVAHAVFLLRNK